MGMRYQESTNWEMSRLALTLTLMKGDRFGTGNNVSGLAAYLDLAGEPVHLFGASTIESQSGISYLSELYLE